ncbi:MAG: NAD(+) kinase [Kangiellaceae bacterium]|jgi:NAD+ kinase|nr:NAD(+) kinase [Kangiellaceae bacterium]|tara:strand:+ start:2995 stop:3870 length:876 start_codon:yes stop_codon:yes gene_type:complete
MTAAFRHIGIMGKQNQGAHETIASVRQLIIDMGLQLSVAKDIAISMRLPESEAVEPEALGEQCDLVIVVGGDGSMLNAGRLLTDSQVPVLGINRGHLGFLTDIRPKDVRHKVAQVLEGQFTEEPRFLLSADIIRRGKSVHKGSALNDVLLYSGAIARIIEFEVYIDRHFVCSVRSDGMIVSTPTGSTAYALSGGGPILHPHLDTIVLVPMCPHTLSSRPICIDGNASIELVVSSNVDHNPKVSCDGQVHFEVEPNDIISIDKKDQKLRLIHPLDHDYFHVLRTKLGWGTKL